MIFPPRDSDVVFFFAYIQPTPKEGATLWSNDQELCDVNGKCSLAFLYIPSASILERRRRDRRLIEKQ